MIHVAYQATHPNMVSRLIRDGEFEFHVPRTSNDLAALRELISAKVRKEHALADNARPLVTIISWNELE